jgi:hypothetical protein
MGIFLDNSIRIESIKRHPKISYLKANSAQVAQRSSNGRHGGVVAICGRKSQLEYLEVE